MKETYGVPVEEIQRGIRAGVRKINVDTDNRLAITGAIRKAFAEKPAEFDPRYYLTPARAAMQKVCEERMKQFGQAGQAPNVPLVSLEDMAKAYVAGTFGASAKPDERQVLLKN
jgi:fructose-bisphosphate aldolase class II